MHHVVDAPARALVRCVLTASQHAGAHSVHAAVQAVVPDARDPLSLGGGALSYAEGAGKRHVITTCPLRVATICPVTSLQASSPRQMTSPWKVFGNDSPLGSDP
jgi:hypothetical protein